MLTPVARKRKWKFAKVKLLKNLSSIAVFNNERVHKIIWLVNCLYIMQILTLRWTKTAFFFQFRPRVAEQKLWCIHLQYN